MKTCTPKQEAFCRAYIETSNASAAYRRAYSAGAMNSSSIAVAACELLSDPKITLMLETLRKPIIQRHAVTVDTLMAELEESRKLALENNAPAAAVSATMGKAKLLGLDKKAGEIDFAHGLADRVAAARQRMIKADSTDCYH